MGVVASQSSCISCNSVLPFNESEETRLSKSIDRGLRETRRNLAHTPKILLLGSGESGKSTIIKQMRILNNVPFTEYEREVYRVQVFYNLVNGMRSLMDALRDLPPLEPSSSTPNDGNGTNLQDNKLTSVEGAGADGSTTRRPAFQPVPPPSPSPTPPENDNEIGSEEGEGEGDIRSLTSKSDPQSHGTTANNTRLALSSNDHVSPSFRTNNDLDSSGGGAGGGGGGNESGKPPSAPSRSPSVSLNLFQPGSLTPRQLTLLQELNYPPDLRPGQPFPLEFEAILRECWWGITPSQWEAIVVQAKEEARRRAGGVTKQDLEKIHLEIECTVLENGLGDQLDRIERESGVHLPDNLKYLYASPGKLGSYFEEEYVPTDQDILRCRGRTTGIQETVFTLGKKGLGGTLNGSEPPSTTYPPGSGGGGPSVAETLNMAMAVDVGAGAGLASTSTPQTQTQQTSQSQSQTQTAQAHVPSTLKLSIGRTRLHFVDVGGQRSERRKWIHCFQDVTGVLFLVGLSGYNQGMIEDSTANQMQDAMSLWDGVCSSQWFKNTALILFLNKTDLFEAKVAKFPINTYFPDYDGDKEDIRAGLEYFRKRFLRIAVKSTRNLRNSDKKSKTGGTRPKAAPSSSSRSKVSAGGGSRKGKGRDREDDDEERPSSTAAAAAAGRKKSRDRLVEESTAGSRKGKGKERERVESNNDQAGQNPQQWSETVTSGTTTNNSYGQTTAVSVSSTSRKGKEREEGERAGVGEMGRIVSGSRSGGGSASTSTRAGGGVAGKSKAKAMESEEERRKRKDSAAAASASAAGGGAGANGGGGSKWRLGAKGGGVDGATKRGRMVYTHFTNATDTLQLRVVILAVCDIILRDNFMNANLI